MKVEPRHVVGFEHAGKVRCAVVLVVQAGGNKARVVYGTSKGGREHWPQVIVRARSRNATALGLTVDTFFYDRAIRIADVLTELSPWSRTGGGRDLPPLRCPPALFLELRKL
ncbi:MAG: hypothetical protein Rubg2KO_40940 [Rubricoccaceae bacterium]